MSMPNRKRREELREALRGKAKDDPCEIYRSSERVTCGELRALLDALDRRTEIIKELIPLAEQIAMGEEMDRVAEAQAELEQDND